LSFLLKFTPEAEKQYKALEQSKNLKKRFTAVKKALKRLAEDPTYPSLQTHKYDSLVGPGKSPVFEAYAENNTSGAYRIFWCYYPPLVKQQQAKGISAKKEAEKESTGKKAEVLPTITVIGITAHP
jgi:hypothetical protein